MRIKSKSLMQSLLHIPHLGLATATLAGVFIIALPTSNMALPIAGQNMLAILLFAIIVWISEAIDYTTSAIIIAVLIIFILGFSPDINNPNIILGTNRALKITLSGFSNPALALVSAAMFISAAMTETGLDLRIALFTMSAVRNNSRSIVIGTIFITILFSLFIPSATARSACIATIMLGIITAFKVDKQSNLAVAIMIVIAQATSIWNVGIQTSAAQNLLSMSLIQKTFGIENSISWLDWLLAGAPWSIVMSIILYFLVLKLFPLQHNQTNNDLNTQNKSLRKLGPMTRKEKYLIIISIILLLLWTTGEKLHSIDTTSITIAGLAIMLLPGIGVINWKDLEKRVQWGTLLTFGIGISLGSALIDTQAASWLANYVVKGFYLENMSPFFIFAILSAFLIIIHLGFSSASALTAALMPILINVLIHLPSKLNINIVGMAIMLTFNVSFGFILPINAPQNMVCLATNTFTPRQFIKIGILLTVIGYLILLIFAATWWKFLGLI